MKFVAASESKDDRPYLALKDGEATVGVFRGEPLDYKRHWVDKRTEPCSGDGCGRCASGNPPRFSFRIQFVHKDKESGKLVNKIWEQGWQVYNQLKDLNADYPLESTWIKISRKGSGMNDTHYMILPIPTGSAVTPVQMEAIRAVAEIDLSPMLTPPPAGQPLSQPPATMTEDDLPF